MPEIAPQGAKRAQPMATGFPRGDLVLVAVLALGARHAQDYPSVTRAGST
jgi:hypothetical protein